MRTSKIVSVIALIMGVSVVGAVASATNFPQQSISTPYAPSVCIDGGTKFENYRYYQGAKFYPYDTFSSTSSFRWIIAPSASMVSVYNPSAAFSVGGGSNAFYMKSNSKPANITTVLVAQNDDGTVATRGSIASATTLGMQIVYNINRVPLVAGNANVTGTYYPQTGPGQFGSMTQWAITNFAQDTANKQQGYECANYYVSRCGDGIVDNGSALPSNIATKDQYGYNIWNGTTNSMNAGEQCDLGAANGQQGSLCNAQCQALPQQLPPDVVVVKSVAGSATSYKAGDEITYQLIIRNIGSGSATNVVVVDNLPANVTYIAGSATAQTSLPAPTYDSATNRLTWNVGTMSAGYYNVITFKAKIGGSVAACSQITNTSTITPDTKDGEIVVTNNTSSATTTIDCGTPDVVTTKSASAVDGVYAPGKQVEYTLTYKNQGAAEATNVVVTDTLPSQVTYVPNSSTSTPNVGQPTVNGNKLVWNIGTLAPGAGGTIKIRVTINADVPMCGSATIRNDFTITASNEPGTITSNNPSNADIPLPCIDLWSKKTVSQSIVNIGDVVTYTISYGNYGSIAADGTVVDTLPAELEYVSNTSTSTPNVGQPTVNGKKLTWNVGTVPAHSETRYISFQAKVVGPLNVGQSYINHVCIEGDNNYNNNNCDEVPVTPPTSETGYIDLSINKLVNGVKTYQADKDEIVEFSLLVRNDGNKTASNFSVKDYLPTGFEFIQASNNGSYNGGTITWNGLTLAPGASIALTFKAKYVDTVARTNYTEICDYNGVNPTNPNDPKDIDSDPCNMPGKNQPHEDDESSATVTPRPKDDYFDLSIDKLINGQKSASAKAGDTVTITLNVTNAGSVGVSNFSVKDYMPIDLEYIVNSSNIAGTTYDSATRQIRFPGLNIGANGSITITFQAKFNGSVTRTNYTEICDYNGVNPTNSNDPKDIDSNPCNRGANPPVEDDESSATITPLPNDNYCGDGIVQSPNSNGQYEACDLGSNNGKQGFNCTASCTIPSSNYCGDGVVQSPNSNGQYEACDLGSNNGKQGFNCTASCTIPGGGGGGSYCGDGIINTPNSRGQYEVCDQGSNGGIIPNGKPNAGRYCYGSTSPYACTMSSKTTSAIPTCAYIDPPSIQNNEYLPIRWDLESKKTNTDLDDMELTTSCSPTTAGKILKSSVQCEFTVKNAKGDIITRTTSSCFDTSVKDQNLVRSAYTQILKEIGYTPSTFPEPAGFKALKLDYPSSALGEHIIEMKVASYATCNEDGSTSSTSTSNTERVCQMNYAVTKPYMVTRGALGDYANDPLTSILQFSSNNQGWSQVFANPVAGLPSTYGVTSDAKSAVQSLIDTYKKLAVKVDSATFSINGTTVNVLKVPSKEIYFFDPQGSNADKQTITIQGAVNNGDKPFTLVVLKGNLIVSENLKGNGMYITQSGKIVFKTDSCTSQDVSGIFISLGGVDSAGPRGNGSTHNINLGDAWCSKGDLTIKGVLIGDGLTAMTQKRRSNVNDWFNDMNRGQDQSKERQEGLLNRGAVVLRYNPTIFSNLPPGAETLSQVLSVYKK